MSVRNLNVSLRERVVEVTMMSDRLPPDVVHVVLRDGESRVIKGDRSTIVETADGFDDLADDVKTFIDAVLSSAKRRGLVDYNRTHLWLTDDGLDYLLDLTARTSSD